MTKRKNRERNKEVVYDLVLSCKNCGKTEEANLEQSLSNYQWPYCCGVGMHMDEVKTDFLKTMAKVNNYSSFRKWNIQKG